MKLNFKNYLVKNSLMLLVVLNLVNIIAAMDGEGTEGGVLANLSLSGAEAPVGDGAAAVSSERSGSASPSERRGSDARAGELVLGANPAQVVHDARIAGAAASAFAAHAQTDLSVGAVEGSHAHAGAAVAGLSVAPSVALLPELSSDRAPSPRSEIRALRTELTKVKLDLLTQQAKCNDTKCASGIILTEARRTIRRQDGELELAKQFEAACRSGECMIARAPKRSSTALEPLTASAGSTVAAAPAPVTRAVSPARSPRAFRLDMGLLLKHAAELEALKARK